MSIHRQNASRDSNEPEIFDAHLQVGNSPARLSGEGVPDLIIGVPQFPHVCPHCGRTFHQPENIFEEIKVGKKGLTDPQKEFHAMWLGQIAIARTVEEALRIAGRID